MIWPRVLARLIDELLWSIPTGLVVVLAATGNSASFDLAPDDVPVWALAVGAVVPALYEFGCLSIWGATFGKWAIGLRVVRFVDGARAAPYQMGLRTVIVASGSLLQVVTAPLSDLRMLFVFVLPALLYSVAFDPLGRGWHDKGAGTIVVRAR